MFSVEECRWGQIKGNKSEFLSGETSNADGLMCVFPSICCSQASFCKRDLDLNNST